MSLVKVDGLFEARAIWDQETLDKNGIAADSAYFVMHEVNGPKFRTVPKGSDEAMDVASSFRITLAERTPEWAEQTFLQYTGRARQVGSYFWHDCPSQTDAGVIFGFGNLSSHRGASTVSFADDLNNQEIAGGIFSGAATALLVVDVSGPKPPVETVDDEMVSRLTSLLIDELKLAGLHIEASGALGDQFKTGKQFLVQCNVSGSWSGGGVYASGATTPGSVSYAVELTTFHIVASPMSDDTDAQGNRRIFRAIGFSDTRKGWMSYIPPASEIETSVQEAAVLLCQQFAEEYRAANPTE